MHKKEDRFRMNKC